MNHSIVSQVRALQRQCTKLQMHINDLERRCDELLGIRKPRRKPGHASKAQAAI